MDRDVSHWMTLSPEESGRVRLALRKLLARHPSQSALARSLAMPGGAPPSQQAVSAALKDDTPVGVTLARAVANAVGVTFDELVTGERVAHEGGARSPRYEDVLGWTEAADDILAKRYLPRYAVNAVGRMAVVIQVESMSPQLLYDLATVWMRHAPLEERIAAERAEVEEEKSREAAEQDALRGGTTRSGEVRRDSAILPRPDAQVGQGR
jgi:hypothetical protein